VLGRLLQCRRVRQQSDLSAALDVEGVEQLRLRRLRAELCEPRSESCLEERIDRLTRLPTRTPSPTSDAV
jgi:hypothetical protein